MNHQPRFNLHKTSEQTMHQDETLPAASVEINFNNLSCSFKHGFWSKKKTILQEVSGSFKCGELTGIMGPSGAGKSTLLNILTGFQKNFEGDLTYSTENSHLTWKSFKKCSRYIQQDDALYPFFTVQETISMAAELKLERNLTRALKEKIIDDVLSSLDLMKTKNTLCGSLSGGERKRFSIALEMLSDPLVMFLDEPTTGLDSSAAMQCATVLKNLARSSKTIICTIHQPSTTIYTMFDHVYLIAEGRCIYQGDPMKIVAYFSNFGLTCPKYHNPADYAMEVMCNEYGNFNHKLSTNQNESWRKNPLKTEAGEKDLKNEVGGRDSKIETGDRHPKIDVGDRYPKIDVEDRHPKINVEDRHPKNDVEDRHPKIDVGDRNPKINVEDTQPKIDMGDRHPKIEKEESNFEIKKHALESEVENTLERKVKKHFLKMKVRQETVRRMNAPSELSNARVLFYRCLLRFYKDWQTTTIWFTLYLGLAILLGTTYYDCGFDATKFPSNLGMLTLIGIVVFYCSLLPAVLKFPFELTILRKEHLNDWYKIRTHYVVFIATNLIYQGFFVCLMTTIVYVMSSQPLEVYRFLMYEAMLVLFAFVGEGIGLILGIMFNPVAGIFACIVVGSSQMSFCGFFIYFNHMAPFMHQICQFVFTKYVTEGVLHGIYGYNRNKLDCPSDVVYCHFRDPNIFLKEIGLRDENFTLDTIVLVTHGTFFFIVAYFLLKKKVSSI